MTLKSDPVQAMPGANEKLSQLSLPEGPWRLLIDYLELRFKAESREKLLSEMREGKIYYRQGEPLGPETAYREKGRLFYWRLVPQESPVPFTESIVFEDEQILVADKPPFLTVAPTGRHLHETLLMRLRKRTGIETLMPAHRIDRETSGLVLFTKQVATRGRYQSLFEKKEIAKSYEAIAPWHTKLPAALHEKKGPAYRHASYLEEAPTFMQMHEVKEREANAITCISLIERNDTLARYLVQPESGKKHQIRVHFLALGIPILNDRIYPTLQADTGDDYTKPLQLLAKGILFIDPLSGETRVFESPGSLVLSAETLHVESRQA